jgi:hypothetical protein
MKIDVKDALADLVDAIMENDAGREIDAGCDGEGPLATALVALGRYKTLKKATDAIWPEGYDE